MPSTRVTVDGSVFDVRVAGGFAEAIRVNPEYAPRFGPIRARAGQAMALVSGCEVKQIKGDQALARGSLDCGSGAPTFAPEPVVRECIPIRGSEIKVYGGVQVELDCSY